MFLAFGLVPFVLSLRAAPRVLFLGWTRADDRPFTVEFALSGVTAEVAVGQTILDVMEELNLDPIFDCRRGECGVCVVDVVSGEPDHRDMNLSEREKNAGQLICTCVSRAKGDRIVLNA